MDRWVVWRRGKLELRALANREEEGGVATTTTSERQTETVVRVFFFFFEERERMGSCWVIFRSRGSNRSFFWCVRVCVCVCKDFKISKKKEDLHLFYKKRRGGKICCSPVWDRYSTDLNIIGFKYTAACGRGIFVTPTFTWPGNKKNHEKQ